MQQLIGLVRKNWIIIALIILGLYFTGAFSIFDTMNQPYKETFVSEGRNYDFQGTGRNFAVNANGFRLFGSTFDGTSSGNARTKLDSNQQWEKITFDVYAYVEMKAGGTSQCVGGASVGMLLEDTGVGLAQIGCGDFFTRGSPRTKTGTIIINKNPSGTGDVFIKECESCLVTFLATAPAGMKEIAFFGNGDTNEDSTAGAGFAKYELSVSNVKIENPTVPNPINFLPSPSALSNILNIIKEWFSNLFSNLFSISGSSEATLPESSGQLGALLAGKPLTYNIVLTSETPVDDKFDDGTYSVRYCTAGMVRKDGTIHSSTVPERCSNTWIKTFETTVPSKVGDYAVVAIMTENKGVFDEATGVWKFSTEEVVAQDALNVKTKAPIPNASQLPQAGFFSKFVSGLLDWFRGLFGG